MLVGGIGSVPQVGEHGDAAGLDLGGLRVLVLVDHVLVERGGVQPVGLLVHPGGDEGGEVEPGVPVEHDLVQHDLVRRLRQHLPLGQPPLRDLQHAGPREPGTTLGRSPVCLLVPWIAISKSPSVGRRTSSQPRRRGDITPAGETRRRGGIFSKGPGGRTGAVSIYPSTPGVGRGGPADRRPVHDGSPTGTRTAADRVVLAASPQACLAAVPGRRRDRVLWAPHRASWWIAVLFIARRRPASSSPRCPPTSPGWAARRTPSRSSSGPCSSPRRRSCSGWRPINADRGPSTSPARGRSACSPGSRDASTGGAAGCSCSGRSSSTSRRSAR